MNRLRRWLARYLLATGRSAPDLSPAQRRIIRAVKPYTKTSQERLASLLLAVEYLHRRRVPGAIAECGVWAGGSMMAVALMLLELGPPERSFWLYDTFDGMPPPTPADRSVTGIDAPSAYFRGWDRVPLATVRRNMASTGWPMDLVRFVEGRVEDTIPAALPGPLAILRLDTDWYESTRHELLHLYPLLRPGGILIIDDYGHWQGARKATDEYFGGELPFLHRVDYTARLIVKP